MSVTVGIEDLRVGMFVHLDLGWWAHPFALSSFALTSPEQIETLRRLGLKTLRWSPEKSLLDAVPAQPALPADAAAAATPTGAPGQADSAASPQSTPDTDAPADEG